MKILISVLIFSIFEFYIISVRLPCQPKGYIKAVIEQNVAQDGEALACLPNLGFDMCVHMCERTTNCSYVEHNSSTASCCLIKAENFTLDVSNCSITLNTTVIGVLSTNKVKICGQQLCNEAAICTNLKTKRNACVELIDHIWYCSIDRHLVTGKYGVNEDRVSFSTVRGAGQGDYWYQLDSAHGWTPAYNDQNPWIQVLFYRRRLVTGIVTRGLADSKLDVYVKAYTLEYLYMSNTWANVLDEAGNVTVFQGNVNWHTTVTNYLSHPIRTAGIRLRPVSWNDHLILRFDVLGC